MAGRKEVLTKMNRSLFAVVRNFERLRIGFAKDEGVSVTELRALTRIAEEGKVTPKQLAASLDLTTGAVTAVTDRLVEDGLVAREPHPNDRRSLLLSATPAGVTIVRNVVHSFEKMLTEGAAGVDDERLAEFQELLDVLVERVKAL